MSIHFNFASMLSDAIGNMDGITAKELNSTSSLIKNTAVSLAEIRRTGELPFWDLPFNNKMIDEVAEFANKTIDNFDDFVQIGIGGSALGPIALHGALCHIEYNLLSKTERGGCRFFCPDNVDPDLFSGTLDVINLDRALIHIVSKSGGTAETISQFLIIVDLLKKKLGNVWQKHIVISTDPEKGILRKFAIENDIKTFPIDSGVGGRFSVLTPVGLLPAAMTGIDIMELCAGARSVSESCFQTDIEFNPSAKFAVLLYLVQALKRKPIHVMFAYSNRLYPIADWFRQLWAESLGKKYDLNGNVVNTGPTPIKAIGATDQHSQVQLYMEGPNDKTVIFLKAKSFKSAVSIPSLEGEAVEADYLAGSELGKLLNIEQTATAFALTNAHRPNMTIELDHIDARHIGALLYLLESSVLYAGALYNVNPLDQPGVEQGKHATFALMGKSGYEAEKSKIDEWLSRDTASFSLEL